jgi:hypothetical protein
MRSQNLFSLTEAISIEKLLFFFFFLKGTEHIHCATQVLNIWITSFHCSNHFVRKEGTCFHACENWSKVLK